ncbi:hypothetical protein SCA6_012167 [Theobroma cacao]
MADCVICFQQGGHEGANVWDCAGIWSIKAWYWTILLVFGDSVKGERAMLRAMAHIIRWKLKQSRCPEY